MTDRQNKLTTWITIAIVLFGMASSAIAFSVTTRNKASENEANICTVDERSTRNETRLNAHDVKISDIDEMKRDIKDLKEQNTEILVALGRIEERLCK